MSIHSPIQLEEFDRSTLYPGLHIQRTFPWSSILVKWAQFVALMFVQESTKSK